VGRIVSTAHLGFIGRHDLNTKITCDSDRRAVHVFVGVENDSRNGILLHGLLPELDGSP
jgi:hypothetical protein